MDDNIHKERGELLQDLRIAEFIGRMAEQWFCHLRGKIASLRLTMKFLYVIARSSSDEAISKPIYR